MADLPILFSAPMVRALLDGRKTQTRRVVNPQPFADGYYDGEIDCTSVPAKASNLSAFFRFGASAVGGGAVRTMTWTPRYTVGDRLYVREGWRTELRNDDISPRDLRVGVPVYYEAGGGGEEAIPECAGRFRQGMHMPRWASRLTLTVTEVRVQRLQEINKEDAFAEGVECWSEPGLVSWRVDDAMSFVSAVDAYRLLWDSLNADRAPWASNPWVAAYTFTVHRGNIDQVQP